MAVGYAGTTWWQLLAVSPSRVSCCGTEIVVWEYAKSCHLLPLFLISGIAGRSVRFDTCRTCFLPRVVLQVGKGSFRGGRGEVAEAARGAPSPVAPDSLAVRQPFFKVSVGVWCAWPFP